MKLVANEKNHAEFLGDIPAFWNCAIEVLEEFVAYGAFEVQHEAGQAVCSRTECDQNLYVLVSGTATLDAGDGVEVTLRPGDYFGRKPGRHLEIVASVIANEDVTVLVIRPEQVQVLERASSRHRHPSLVEWRTEFATPGTRMVRRGQRTLVAS